MVIDSTKYKLKEDNFFEDITLKQQIVIGNSLSNNLKNINGWETRDGGKYKRTSTFSIDKKGNIYQHYDDSFYSEFSGDVEIDKKIITISLDNLGWVIKDLLKDRYIDWVGNIYKRRAKVINKRWRGFQFWEPYTPKQFNACIDLVTYLCDKHKINKKCVGHNTYIKDIETFNGVSYKSNYHKELTDVSPAWDFKKFKNKIEKK